MPALLPALRTARSQVRRACDLLRSPSSEALDGCAEALENAVVALSGGRAVPTPRDGPALAEALQLQAAVGSAARLLQGAADYHARWLQVLGALTAGYTARGEAAPVVRPQRIRLSG